jgi:hypothetical protein
MKDLLDFELDWRKKYSEIFPNLFTRTYRNIDFCIEECKSICEQLKEKENEIIEK